MREYHPTILYFVRMLLDRVERTELGDSGLFLDEDIGLCGELVRLAGFELVEVKRGVLDRIVSSGDPEVMNMRIVGVRNPITNMRFTCANVPDDFATKWFEQLVRGVVSDVTCGRYCKNSGETRVMTWGWEFVDEEVTRAHPFKPIPLTDIGDAMGEVWPTPRGDDFFVTHRRDTNAISQELFGVHMICRGTMKCGPATPTHNALWCTKCYLRVPFPRTIGTYGELRVHFEGALCA